VAIIVFYLGRLEAVYELIWGRDRIRKILYEDVGLGDAWSSLIGIVSSFFLAFAWVPLSLWMWRLLSWKFNTRQVVTAFACWVIVYGHVPLILALFGTKACFNQQSGTPLKWYTEGPDGNITLFDSGGYDTERAVQKLPVTAAICSTVSRKRINSRPILIGTDVQSIEFFDPNSGRPRVWYSKGPNGNFMLFDTSGFNPANGERLLEITPEIVREIIAGAQKVQQDRIAVEEEAAKDAELARKHEEIRIKIEQESLAKAEAEKRAAAAREAQEYQRQAEQEAQAKAEAQQKADAARKAQQARLQAEQEAQAKAEAIRRERAEKEADDARQRARKRALQEAQDAAEIARQKLLPCFGIEDRFYIVRDTIGQ